MTDDTTTTAPTPYAIADQAAEAIRSLNHLTRPDAAGLTYPSDVYDVLGSLHQLAYRLPQALGQLSAWLNGEHAAGRIGQAYLGADPAEYVAAVTDALHRASEDATALAAALDTAHQSAATLTGETTP